MTDRLAVLEASRHGPFLSYDRFDNGDNDADREDSGLYDSILPSMSTLLARMFPLKDEEEDAGVELWIVSSRLS